MAPIVEFEGKTVEIAVKEASEKLNIPARKLKHDVISHGSTGIFGLVGAKRAKIRVSVSETEVCTVSDESTATPSPETDEAAALVEEAFDVRIDDEESAAAEKIGRDALQAMVDHITTDATIDSNQKAEKIFYNVSGGNTAVLIGKRGQTLEAMQYLVEKIVNKQSEKRVRIEIDVEGYLEKKREKLKNLAIKLGEKVKQTKKPATVGQLNAYDRRIVHLTLKPDSELRTHSIGEGYYRKLKIFPKQRRRRGKSNKAANQ
jgi:spoIIIJ-associated protein